MTKKHSLIKNINQAARERGLEFTQHRSGGNHDIYTLDGQRISIPRHTEINELTAKGIYKQAAES